ncbi:MAG: TcpE family conjugal transfer membrane protein [Propionicimonas sp.]
MELRTHTNLWQVDKYLYRIEDVNLPFPVPLKAVGFLAMAGLPWCGLMALFQVPFTMTPPTYMIYLVPPAAVAYMSTKRTFESKTFGELVVSQVKYVFQPKHLSRLQPAKKLERVLLYADLWRPRDHPEVTVPDEDLQSDVVLARERLPFG